MYTDEDDFFADLPPATPGATAATPPVRVGRKPRVKSPKVRLDGVDPQLIDFAASRDLMVTSGRDAPGVHVKNSAHGRGDGLDFRTRDKTPAEIARIAREAEAEGLGILTKRHG